MTAAETLRTAARLMRERASVARAGRWFADGPDILAHWQHDDRYIGTCDAVPSPDGNVLNADHIASWDPTVALAVAAWLEEQAEQLDNPASYWLSKSYARRNERALAVAHAYLNTQDTP